MWSRSDSPYGTPTQNRLQPNLTSQKFFRTIQRTGKCTRDHVISQTDFPRDLTPVFTSPRNSQVHIAKNSFTSLCSKLLTLFNIHFIQFVLGHNTEQEVIMYKQDCLTSFFFSVDSMKFTLLIVKNRCPISLPSLQIFFGELVAHCVLIRCLGSKCMD